MGKVIKGRIDGSGKRCAIVVGRFNDLVTDRLLHGAEATLVQLGVAADAIDVVWVPGAFELPLACRWLAETGKYDAIVAVGAVIRGATSHFDHVCNQSARGILDAGVATGVPIGFGLLTCETLEQALERAGSKGGNKGSDAALAALEMLAVRSAIDGS